MKTVGRLGYRKDIGFLYVNVDDDLAFLGMEIARKSGFRIRYNIFKQMDPGVYFCLSFVCSVTAD